MKMAAALDNKGGHGHWTGVSRIGIQAYTETLAVTCMHNWQVYGAGEGAGLVVCRGVLQSAVVRYGGVLCAVWCGAVQCGVVWCAEGAATKWQWPGCLAHGKMQNGWALILKL